MVHHLRAFCRNIFKRESANAELDEEIRGYLEMTTEEKTRCGITPEDAIRDARRELGGVEQVKQKVRDSRAGVDPSCRRICLRVAFPSMPIFAIEQGHEY